MIFKGIQKTKLLKKGVFAILFFLITFFPCFKNSDAAYFKYSEFNWDKFAEEHKEYWTQHCVNDTEGGSKTCVEAVLNRQKKYYTRLYALLAKYQKKGLLINDNTIIMTSFFELDPDTFSDDGEYYKSVMGSDAIAYNVDDASDMANYDINQDDNNPDVFENETDTLKLLLKAMIGYSYVCYGSYGKPDKEIHEGTEISVCNNGGTFINGKCLTKINSGYMGFWDYMMSNNNLFKFFGIVPEKEKECDALDSNYPDGTDFVPGNTAEVSEEKYWEFLEKGDFFDRKPHLQSRFSIVLEATGHEKMEDLTNSEKAEYEEEILDIRRRIISDIKAILENYGSNNMMSLYTNASSDAYWWPVGSAEETPDGTGKIFAIGDPVSTTITSGFGMRYHPISGEYKKHNGVDLVGNGSADAVYNVIASKDGIVTKVINTCTNGDSGCGGGFGCHVIISHADGNKTVYAHMANSSIIVSEGESVSQGQIIGKMGTTGSSTGVHLHFEMHVNDVPVDPMDYISAEYPRPASMAGSDLEAMLLCFEGPGPDDGGSNYKVYDDNCTGPQQANNQSCGGILTIGRGVNIEAHYPKFEARGISKESIWAPGRLVSKSIVDEIAAQILSGMYDSVNSTLSANGITLKTHQIDALVSRCYNYGNINGFVSNYKIYASTHNAQVLYDNFFKGNGTKRRDHEWNLFLNGIYYTC